MVHHKFAILLVTAVLLCGCAAGEPHSNDTARSAPSDAVPEAAAYTGSIAATHAEEERSGSSMPIFDSSCPARSNASTDDTAPLRSNVRFSSGYRAFEADDGTTILYESYDEGAFSTADPSTEEWVNGIINDIGASYHAFSQEMLSNARTHYQDFKDTFYCYSNYLSMGVGRHDSRMLSLLTLNSVYSGGAHPGTVQSAYNLDLVQQKKLCLEDVIQPEGEKVIRQIVQDDLERRFIDGDTLMLYEEYTDTLDGMLSYGSMTQNWYMNQEGLVIYFNQYEIAPYAAGIIKVEIPYEDLVGILKEEYMPQATGEDRGAVVLLSSIGSAQDELRIGIEGTVHRLRVMKEEWMDGTCISSKMVLSAGNPCAHENFSFSGELEPDEVFSLEYFTGNGEAKKYYIWNGVLIDHWPE